ncbi:hypothetical protein Lfu02_55570 [Longispora fulva]|uniref:LPXTG-motif cell wall-anchored protein n=1 Tax=Longispora fulva TaxID=619741 RepID=A0A8J7KGK0_9ACTN|nr:hypothetical protein [Longispora fulva]MBG6137460.1 hypothetical protein [Longispora fulva]GIG61185.1 hypothetical protein Lfu02_55570 [Longispora fulva]
MRLHTLFAGLGVATALLLAAPATAAPGIAGPTAADLATARAAASLGDAPTRLARFFVQLDEHAAGRSVALTGDGADRAAAAKSPSLTGAAEAVYSLNPAFVAGDRSAPVALFAYATVEARSADGQRASVWIAQPGGSTWEAVNISSTVDEVAYPRQAGADLVFTEPQVNAWYKVHDGRVVPLNDTARAIVGAGVGLAGYQDVVHGRYGDKLPGSDYANQGKLGGFGVAAPETTDNSAAWAGLGVLTASGVVGAVLIVSRRRRETA